MTSCRWSRSDFHATIVKSNATQRVCIDCIQKSRVSVVPIHMCVLLRNVTAVPYSVHIIVIVNRKDAVKELNCYAAVNTLVCRLLPAANRRPSLVGVSSVDVIFCKWTHSYDPTFTYNCPNPDTNDSVSFYCNEQTHFKIMYLFYFKFTTEPHRTQSDVWCFVNLYSTAYTCKINVIFMHEIS